MAIDFPESHDAAHWRRINLAVPLVFGFLSTATYLARLYVTVRIVRRARTEDYLMGIAVLLMLGDMSCVLTRAVNGIGVPDSDLPAYRLVNYNLATWLSTKFWSASIAAAKLAIILFLRRLLASHRRTCIALIILAAAVTGWGATNFLYTICLCSPVAAYWDGRDAADSHCVGEASYMAEGNVVAWSGLAMNLAILGISAAGVRRLRLTLRHKVAVTLILGVGAVACIVSILRAVQFATPDGMNRSSPPAILLPLLSVLETNLMILSGTLPHLLAPLSLSRHPLSDRPQNSPDAAQPRPSYLGSRDPTGVMIRSWGFSKMNAIETSVVGAHESDATPVRPASPRHGLSPCERQNSSEIELKGIEVQTTIDQKISTGRGPDRYRMR